MISKSKKEYSDKEKNRRRNWDGFIKTITNILAFKSRNDNHCNCNKMIKQLLTISFQDIFICFSVLIFIEDCYTLSFDIYDPSCPSKDAILGFLSQGYFPSSPKKPEYAIEKNIIDFFYEMNMTGTCSKQVFYQTLHPYLQKHGLFHNLLQQLSAINISQCREIKSTSELQRDTLISDIINKISISTQLTPISQKNNELINGSIKHFTKINHYTESI